MTITMVRTCVQTLGSTLYRVTTPAYTKQEQVPATSEIEQVAQGVFRTQLPIDMPGLGHVNMYVLEDSRGVSVVDPGLPGKANWKAIVSRLKDLGVPVKRVHSIVITHSHPDHFGGAMRLQQHTGADIITHESFRLWFDPTEPDDVDVETQAQFRRAFDVTPWGGPGFYLPRNRRLYYLAHQKLPRFFPLPKPTVRLAEHEHITLAGRKWLALHTPGHTQDHLCLFDPDEGTMLSGDHVLPTITPHISGMSNNPDPLLGFFQSLDKIASFGEQVRVSLPAHGKPFEKLADRCDQIKLHHEQRLTKLRDVAADLDRPTTVMDFSKHLFSPRAQGAMADSETYAHLEHLRLAGEFARTADAGVHHYVRVS
jgi:glyoxylase-like metal-dependent hydrolase (beta-lactamase superfamily II)